jgi:hypothetical protein
VKALVMGHRVLTFMYAANWVFAAVFACMVMIQWDEAAPTPARALVSVVNWDESRSADEMRAMMASFAQDEEIAFAQQVYDFDDRFQQRNIYLHDSDDAVDTSDWVDGGYRDFTASIETRVFPYGDLGGHAITGNYLVFSDAEKAQRFADFLTSQGAHSEVMVVDWDAVAIEILGPMWKTLWTMVLAAVAVAGTGVLMATRSYGVGRLHGISLAGLIAADLRRVGAVLAVSVAAVAAAGLIGLWAYNGLTAWWTWFAVFVCLGVVLSSVTVAVHAASLALISGGKVLNAVKGELPNKTVLVVGYALRLFTVGTSVVLLGQLVSAGIEMAARAANFAAYEEAGDASVLSLGGMSSIEEETALFATVGSWIRGEDRGGRAILVGEEELAGQRAYFVNERFLHEQPVRLADGTVYVPDDQGPVVTVLVPAGREDQRSSIESALADIAAFRVREELRGQVAYEWMESAAGQEVFTYNAEPDVRAQLGADGGDRSYATNPVLVVLPSEEGLLTDASYIDFASGGEVVFPDPSVVAEAVARDPEFGRFVLSATPVSAVAEAEYGELVREFRIVLFGALGGVAVLLIAGTAVAMIHARRNAQLIFARHVNGWRFTAVHRALLLFEAGVLLVLIGYAPYQVWSMNRSELARYEALGIPAPFEPASVSTGQWIGVVTLALVVVGGVIVALARAHRRVVAEGASEA